MTEPQRVRRPRIDTVIAAIGTGAYDDHVKEIYDAVMGRKAVLQQKVLEQVKDVFGDDYGITRATPSRLVAKDPNPFIAKAEQEGRASWPLDETPAPTEAAETQKAPEPVIEVTTPGGSPMDPQEEAQLRESDPTAEDLGPDFESRSPIFGPLPE